MEVWGVLRCRGLYLRMVSGAWVSRGLVSDDLMTKLFVVMLAGVLEFQCEMVSGNTEYGVGAARAVGKVFGRPAVLKPYQVADLVAVCYQGVAVKGLARWYGVFLETVRRALDSVQARILPEAELAALDPTVPVILGVPVTFDVSGLFAEHLQDVDDHEVCQALAAGRTIRRGQGCAVRVTAPAAVHRAVLERCEQLAGAGVTPAACKGYRTCAVRVRH